MCKASDVNGEALDPDSVRLQLRELQKALNNKLKAITGCHNR